MILSKIFGTKSEREIKKLSTEIDKINQSYDLLLDKSEEDLIVRTNELRNYVISTRQEAKESAKNVTDKKTRNEKILKAEVDPLVGAQPYQGRELAFKLGLKGVQIKQFTQIFLGLAQLFQDKDLALIEINPLVIKEDGDLHCLDAKLGVDGNALYRQKDVQAMNDPSQEDAREAEAAEQAVGHRPDERHEV